MTGINLNKHHCLTSSGSVKAICKPLYHLGINYFTLDRIHLNGSRSILTTDPKWIEFYYGSEFYDLSLFEPSTLPTEKCTSYWSAMLDNPVYKAAEEFDIAKGVTLIIKHPGYWDFYSFGTIKNNSNMSDSFLANNAAELDRFILYFKDKGRKLIEESSKHIIQFNQLPMDFCLQSNDITLSKITSCDQFYKETKINRYFLDGEFEGEYITKKEIQIIDLLLQGKTQREISEKVHITQKTIESHIAHIRKKFKSTNMVQLALKIRDTHLFDFLKCRSDVMSSATRADFIQSGAV
jgi:DNA-binding CsgD family transcriptional regulator